MALVVLKITFKILPIHRAPSIAQNLELQILRKIAIQSKNLIIILPNIDTMRAAQFSNVF